MSGVWVFKRGVVRLVENPKAEETYEGRRKVLVHVASEEIMTSYGVLERKLKTLGWERYYGDLQLRQYHKASSIDLISLPKDFNNFKPMHMFDIIVKNRNIFQVRDI